MILQNPGFLWGLLFLIVPILVHFFDFRRVKRIDFSNVNFLRKISRENTPRNRLKELLVLCLRLLGLAFIVLAFSNPRLPSQESFLDSTSIVFVDNSISMTDKCGNEDCLQRAKVMTLELGLNQGIVDYLGNRKPRNYYDQEELEFRLRNVSPSKAYIQEFDRSNDYLVISDFQSGVIDQVMDADSSKMVLVPLSSNARANVFVDSVYTNGPMSLTESRVKIVVAISNSGGQSATDLLVRLMDMERQLSTQAIDIGEDETVNIEFEFEPVGLLDLYVELDDGFSDFDNRYYFSISKPRYPKVAVVSAIENRYLQTVFQNSALFESRVFTQENIDFQFVRESDLVVLNEYAEIPDWFDLKDLSGDLVVIPSPDINESDYEIDLGVSFSKIEDTTSQVVDYRQMNSPFFSGVFDNLSADIDLPRVQNLYAIDAPGEDLIRSRYSYLKKIVIGDGRLYFFSSPIRDEFSDFQNHSLFVPVFYRIAEQSVHTIQDLAHSMDVESILTRASGANSEVLRLLGPDTEFIVQSYVNEDQLIVSIPQDVNEPGHYYLMLDDDTLQTIALNVPRRESVRDQKSASELRDIFSDRQNVRILDVSDQLTLRAGLEELQSGTSLWKYALVLALMLFIAESAILKWK